MSRSQLPNCRFLIVVIAGVVAIGGGTSNVYAAEADAPHDSINPREAFREVGKMPWYDSANDTLKPMVFSSREPITVPNFPGFSLRWLAWTLLAVLLAGLAYLMYKFFGNFERGEKVADNVPELSLAVADRVEALPFLARRSQDDLLGEARRQYALGNFSEAIIYLFSHQLVELDRSSLVRLAKGKTNRQYLREAAQIPDISRLLGRTMVTFEDVFFGKRVLDRQGFEACWNELPAFQTLLGRAAT